MAWIDDITVVNDAGTQGDWTSSGFQNTQSSDSSSNTPLFLEGNVAMELPLKKGITSGYTYTNVISGTPSMTGKILVAFIYYPYPDIKLIPISSMYIRMSSATTFTTNYAQWDAKAQILSPENTPISGHTPIVCYPDAATETGTPNYGSVESVGIVASTGSDADGKQGGFDWFFIISYVGAHSATLTNTFFSGVYDEYYDNEGLGLPGQTSRPIAVLSQAGNFFNSNISFQFGHGTSDTANTVISETGKTIFFNNVHTNHQLGYVFVNPSGVYTLSLTLTDCVHFWNDQNSTAEIFKDPENADTFKVTGCAFSKGGIFESPPDSVNRWIRSTKFDGCQTGVISNGEFTDNIVSNCLAVTVSGDADLTGCSFLTPAVAADAAGLVWNGAFDPNGNLDGMTFSKGTNAHHAIEFGISTPLTMTLTDIAFGTGWGADTTTSATLHIKRTTGTVTINLVGCSGTITYKSAGATVSLVADPVTTLINVKDTSTGLNIQNANVLVYVTDGTNFPYNASVTITGTGTTATVTHTSHGLSTNDKVMIDGANEDEYNGTWSITYVNANSYTYTTARTVTATPATGTITATFAFIKGLTDASGNISDSRVVAIDQPIAGWARKMTASPYYKQGAIAGTVDDAVGFSANVQLVSDE